MVCLCGDRRGCRAIRAAAIPGRRFRARCSCSRASCRNSLRSTSAFSGGPHLSSSWFGLVVALITRESTWTNGGHARPHEMIRGADSSPSSNGRCFAGALPIPRSGRDCDYAPARRQRGRSGGACRTGGPIRTSSITGRTWSTTSSGCCGSSGDEPFIRGPLRSEGPWVVITFSLRNRQATRRCVVNILLLSSGGGGGNILRSLKALVSPGSDRHAEVRCEIRGAAQASRHHAVSRYE